MFFTRSGWLLSYGLLTPDIGQDFAREFFSPFVQNNIHVSFLIAASYPLVWYIIKELFTSVSVNNGGYLLPSKNCNRFNNVEIIDFVYYCSFFFNLVCLFFV